MIAQHCVGDYLSGESDREFIKIKPVKSKLGGGILRISLSETENVIVKYWYLNNIKQKVKSIIRVSNGCIEWQKLCDTG